MKNTIKSNDTMGAIVADVFQGVGNAWTRVAKLLATACLIIIFLVLLDRLLSSAFATEFIANVANEQLQAILTTIAQWIGRIVDFIGASARTYIPWNPQDADLYSRETWLLFA